MRTSTKANEHIDLTLTGMTCAACAARIEKKLNSLEGVTATVNYRDREGSRGVRPERSVHRRSVGSGRLDRLRRRTSARTADYTEQDDADDRVRRALLRRLIVATVLGVPVLVISMVPALQFRNWQWVAFALATPVATWAAARSTAPL